jgi:hypothetical protein
MADIPIQQDLGYTNQKTSVGHVEAPFKFYEKLDAGDPGRAINEINNSVAQNLSIREQLEITKRDRKEAENFSINQLEMLREISEFENSTDPDNLGTLNAVGHQADGNVEKWDNFSRYLDDKYGSLGKSFKNEKMKEAWDKSMGTTLLGHQEQNYKHAYTQSQAAAVTDNTSSIELIKSTVNENNYAQNISAVSDLRDSNARIGGHSKEQAAALSKKDVLDMTQSVMQQKIEILGFGEKGYDDAQKFLDRSNVDIVDKTKLTNKNQYDKMSANSTNPNVPSEKFYTDLDRNDKLTDLQKQELIKHRQALDRAAAHASVGDRGDQIFSIVNAGAGALRRTGRDQNGNYVTQDLSLKEQLDRANQVEQMSSRFGVPLLGKYGSLNQIAALVNDDKLIADLVSKGQTLNDIRKNPKVKAAIISQLSSGYEDKANATEMANMLYNLSVNFGGFTEADLKNIDDGVKYTKDGNSTMSYQKNIISESLKDIVKENENLKSTLVDHAQLIEKTRQLYKDNNVGLDDKQAAGAYHAVQTGFVNKLFNTSVSQGWWSRLWHGDAMSTGQLGLALQNMNYDALGVDKRSVVALAIKEIGSQINAYQQSSVVAGMSLTEEEVAGVLSEALINDQFIKTYGKLQVASSESYNALLPNSEQQNKMREDIAYNTVKALDSFFAKKAQDAGVAEAYRTDMDNLGANIVYRPGFLRDSRETERLYGAIGLTRPFHFPTFNHLVNAIEDKTSNEALAKFFKEKKYLRDTQ